MKNLSIIYSGGLKNKLANDLKEYGKGFSRTNLYEMMKFADFFDETEIIQQPVGQIPWRTIIEIMSKSKTHEEMLYYINETHNKCCYRN